MTEAAFVVDGIDGKRLMVDPGRPDCAVALTTAWPPGEGRYAVGPEVKLDLEHTAQLALALAKYLQDADWGGEVFNRLWEIREYLDYLREESGLDDLEDDEDDPDDDDDEE